jgi:hypothetical protein
MEQEISPGRSVVHRHDRLNPSRLGVTDSEGFTEAREAAYSRLFGRAESVSHEILPLIPHVDVYTYDRTEKDGPPVYALVTGGMSDLEMTVPVGVLAPRRVELIFYCSEPKQEYIDTLRRMAHFPHNQKTWVGWGHTMSNGNPPTPYWGSSVLDTFLFMQTILTHDATLPKELSLGGEPVHFLWLVPLSTAECNLKLASGFGAILSLFQRNHHPYVFDPGRQSYL